MEDSANKVEEEVRRLVEQAKELQESAASLISRSSSEEQSLRQRALSLDSSIRRLRSSIHSLLANKLLDPKLADRVCFFFLSFRRFLNLVLSYFANYQFRRGAAGGRFAKSQMHGGWWRCRGFSSCQNTGYSLPLSFAFLFLFLRNNLFIFSHIIHPTIEITSTRFIILISNFFCKVVYFCTLGTL